MPMNHNEIIAEIQNHIKKLGGASGDWCVGTAKDPRSPFFESHRVAEKSDGLIYREAFTASGAQAARDYLVNECGLRLDLDAAPEPGRIRRGSLPSPIATITNRCMRHPRFKSQGRARPAPPRRCGQPPEKPQTLQSRFALLAWIPTFAGMTSR